MGRSSWVIAVGPKYDHKCTYKGEAEGALTTEKVKAM